MNSVKSLSEIQFLIQSNPPPAFLKHWAESASKENAASLKQINNAPKAHVKLQKQERTETAKALAKRKPDAKAYAKNAEKARFSRNLVLAKQNEQLKVVCDFTGIVSLMDIPTIPGFVLSYYHPLAEVPNARGVAQQGNAYLQKLSTQVLAGILITLADDYELFRYQPSDSGAQKNAIIRSIHRETLISAILLIEESINSGNSEYLPGFSMMAEADMTRGSLDVRFTEYLKLITEAIFKPDTAVWDENMTPAIEQKQWLKSKSKEENLAAALKIQREKELKKDLKEAITRIKSLFKEDKISVKLRTMLGGLFQEYQLLTMEPDARMLLKSKLEQIVSEHSKVLIQILEKDRGDLVAKNVIGDDFFDATEEKVSVIKPEGTIAVVSIVSKESAVECSSEETVITIGEKQFVVNKAKYAAMSFLETVKYKKHLIAGGAA
ncbi:hypothetical protein Tiera_050 [Polaromonas phage Tiera]|nr:hypothetical protein Tiera_050 [Polaromonas phage Tiera]